MTVRSSWIDVAADGGTMPAYLALPPTGKGPGILLFQEIFGVNSHIRGVADQYAQAGYVVLAPDVFWRAEPHIELGYAEPDMSRAIALMQQLDPARTLSDAAAAAKALRSRPELTGKIAAVGYCFGGRMSYLSASEGLVDAAVPYYGGGIQDKLDVASKIKVPMLFHYA